MTTVRQVLKEKEHELWSIHPDDSIRDAMKMMMERDIGSLLVISDAKLLGIVTERRFARNVVSRCEPPVDIKVSKIMEPPIPCVGPNDTIEECMALMTKRRVRYLPVLRQGNPIGILSIGDIVNWIICDQRTTIVHLEHYIHGQVANRLSP
jgi:CBS domain-containing protein